MWAVAHETFVIHNSEHAQTYILTSQAPTPPPLKKINLAFFCHVWTTPENEDGYELKQN